MARATHRHAVPAEPTFEQAQSWWSKMQRPVTFVGAPGHPHHPTVLWNTGLLFCSNPYDYPEGRPRYGSRWHLAPSLSEELRGDELDALQIEFSFGKDFRIPDRLHNSGGEIEQELLEGRMPVVISRLKHDGLEWTCAVFAHAAADDSQGMETRHLLTEVRWTVQNPGRRARRALLSCHLTAPHIIVGYKVRMDEVGAPYLRALRWEAPLLVDDRRRARLAAKTEQGDGEVQFRSRLPEEEAAAVHEGGLDRDVLQYRAQVPAGGSACLRLIVPFTAVPAGETNSLRKALRLPFDAALAKTQKVWKRVFSASHISTPESVVNESCDAYLYHAMIASARRPLSGHSILKCSPNNYEGVWSAHSAIAAYSMDIRGQHDLSRCVLETFLSSQCPLPDHILKLFSDKQVGESEGFSAHPGFLGNIEGYMAVLWSFYHGWILWAIGQHARLTNDWGWLRRHADRLALACEWIEEQRKRTRRRDEKGEKVLAYGLLPAANAFDWGFGHMFWSDAHTYRGLREIGKCLQRIRHPKSKQFLAQADDYRSDIIAAVTRSRDAASPVPLENGSTIPFVPMSVEMRDYFAPDWTYISCGPLNLAWAGVVPAEHELIQQVLAFLEAGRPLGKWDESQKKYQGWDWAARTPADEDFLEMTRPTRGRSYFWRHKMTYEPGWIPQAFTFLMQDDMPALLEHFYSLISNGGQHVNLRSPVEQRDGVPWTQPGNANLLWLTRDMLVREMGNDLILCGSCPRSWLTEGQAIAVTNLPTHFGSVSYRMETGMGRITGSFRFRFHTPPRAIRLRLRRPDGDTPGCVTVNGKPVPSDGEWIRIPTMARRLEATYGRY